MGQRYQSKSGTKKARHKKPRNSTSDAPIATGGVMTGMVSNFRQMVTMEKNSGSKVGKYFWAALAVIVAIAFAFFMLR